METLQSPERDTDSTIIIVYVGTDFTSGVYKTNRENMYLVVSHRLTTGMIAKLERLFFIQAVIYEHVPRRLSSFAKYLVEQFSSDRYIARKSELPFYTNLNYYDRDPYCEEPTCLQEGDSVFKARPIDASSYLGPIPMIDKI